MKRRLFSFLLALCLVAAMLPVLPREAKAAGKPVDRVYGATRYDTAFLTADLMKQKLGVDKFSNIIVASGTNFADALGGSYLAVVKQAPILLVQKSNVGKVQNYIRNNLQEGGTVYLLGGVNAVPKEMEYDMNGFVIKRLGGADRYETNLLILQESEPTQFTDIVVCTGTNYADSLSASALGMPILLVKNEVTKTQRTYLKKYLTYAERYIIGGYSAVNEKIEDQLEGKSTGSGDVYRIDGSTRYQTSVMVAQWFYANPKDVVIAYGKNFPDGLCAGPYAYLLDCPMILTASTAEAPAAAYIQQQEVQNIHIWGGPSLISEKSANMLSTGFSYASRKTELPNLATFLKRQPDETNNKFRKGIKVEFEDLPEGTENAVVAEVLALLQDDRYQLELVGQWTRGLKTESGFRTVRYNFLYVGDGGNIDLLSQEPSYAEMYNVQLKVVYPMGTTNAKHDVGIYLHYGKGFDLVDPGKRVSVYLPNPDDGGDIDDDGDDDKDCRSCNGSGKCKKCGGLGYTKKWLSGTTHTYVKQDCTSCANGKCRSCWGSGKQ